jgi:hypothetical protein
LTADDAEVERSCTVLRRLTSLATLVMLGLSWPLWIDGGAIPRVPFARGLDAVLPPLLSWGLFAGLLVAVTLAAFGRRWQRWYVVSAGMLVALIVRDQHRFQPWTYQYVVTCFLIAFIPGRSGLRFAQWWFVALYLHSGLSKLDAAFCAELGPIFLEVLMRPFGLDPQSWPILPQNLAILAMPLGELFVAGLLVSPRSRRAGCIGALALHGLLLAILGPLGLRHSATVLVWNAAMMCEVWVAFRPALETSRMTGSHKWPGHLVRCLFWAGVVLPLGERFGLFDPWPSHALYASHVGRVTILLDGEFPDHIARHCTPMDELADDGWRRLDVTAWSRHERGTPPYAGPRASLGLAEGLAVRYGGVGRVRVVLLGPASLWTGTRTREEATGLGPIRALGDRFILNARAEQTRAVL